MNPWVARIALVAYLVGGWILPAAHNHGSIAQRAGSWHQVFDDVTGASNCSCSVSHLPSTTDVEILADDDPILFGVQVHDCDGLCTLCVARTLVSQPMQSGSSIGNRLENDSVIVIDNDRGTTEHADCWTARGPPAIV